MIIQLCFHHQPLLCADPHLYNKLRLVCQDWKEFIDNHPKAWILLLHGATSKASFMNFNHFRLSGFKCDVVLPTNNTNSSTGSLEVDAFIESQTSPVSVSLLRIDFLRHFSAIVSQRLLVAWSFSNFDKIYTNLVGKTYFYKKWVFNKQFTKEAAAVFEAKVGWF